MNTQWVQQPTSNLSYLLVNSGNEQTPSLWNSRCLMLQRPMYGPIIKICWIIFFFVCSLCGESRDSSPVSSSCHELGQYRRHIFKSFPSQMFPHYLKHPCLEMSALSKLIYSILLILLGKMDYLDNISEVLNCVKNLIDNYHFIESVCLLEYFCRLLITLKTLQHSKKYFSGVPITTFIETSWIFYRVNLGPVFQRQCKLYLFSFPEQARS